MRKYHAQNSISQPTTSVDSSNPYQRAKNLLFANPRSRPQQRTSTVEQEWMLYQAESTDINIDPITYWEVHTIFLWFISFLLHFYCQSNAEHKRILFAMAADYLPIQASSVPCERVFSSSKETTTARRSRMSGTLMEQLQMLKFS